MPSLLFIPTSPLRRELNYELRESGGWVVDENIVSIFKPLIKAIYQRVGLLKLRDNICLYAVEGI